MNGKLREDIMRRILTTSAILLGVLCTVPTTAGAQMSPQTEEG